MGGMIEFSTTISVSLSLQGICNYMGHPSMTLVKATANAGAWKTWL